MGEEAEGNSSSSEDEEPSVQALACGLFLMLLVWLVLPLIFAALTMRALPPNEFRGNFTMLLGWLLVGTGFISIMGRRIVYKMLDLGDAGAELMLSKAFFALILIGGALILFGAVISSGIIA